MTAIAPDPRALTLPRRSGILIALDLPHLTDAERVVAATAELDGVVGYKVGPIAALDVGLTTVVQRLRALTDHALIYDHQKAGLDIGSNAENFAQALARAGVDAAILFPLGGPTSAGSFLDALAAHGVSALVGGALPLADYPISGGGWIADDALAKIIALTLHRGHHDLILPANAQLRTLVNALNADQRAATRLFVPGIGAGGSGLQALAGVASTVAGVYPIVGRAVIAADEPAVAAQQIVDALHLLIKGKEPA